MLDYQDEIGIDWQTDTYDTGLHLNVYGAEKAAKWFGKVLKEHFELSDRRDNTEIKTTRDDLQVIPCFILYIPSDWKLLSFIFLSDAST